MALAVAQVGGNVTTDAGTISATFGSSTATGSLIVAVYHTFGYTAAFAAGDITDNKSNTYSLAANSFTNTNCGTGGMFNNAGSRGASHQLTGNSINNTGESNNLAMIEVTGQDGSAPYDTTTAATASDATSPWSVTAAAAISGNQIAIYAATIDTGDNTAFTQPTGYSNIINQPNGGTSLVSIASYKLNETGTPAVGATSGHTSANARELFITFKEGTGVAAVSDSPYLFDPVDPQGWMFSNLLQNVPLFPDATPYSADPPVSTTDVSVAGYLPVGPIVIGAVTADRNIVGLLPTGVIDYGPISHDTSVTGIVHAGATPYGPVSHDANLAGILYSGPLVLTSGGFDYITTGVLYAAAVPMATVSHTASVAGILEVGVHPLATISHAANVAGLLELGVIPYGPASHDTSVAGLLELGAFAYTGPSFDQSTTGILFAGPYNPTAITTSRTVTGIVHTGPIHLSTVTASRNVAGLLELGATPLAVVTRTTSTLGLVVVGVVPYATFGPVAPLSPVTDTVYLSKPWEAVLLERTGTIWLRTSSTVDTGKATDTPWRRTHQGQVIE